MPDLPSPLSVAHLAGVLGAELIGPPGLLIWRVEALEHADDRTLTFIRSPRYAALWARSSACAALVSRTVPVPEHDASRRALLIVPDADHALIKLLTILTPPAPKPEPGVHPGAVVHPSAAISAGAHVGPMCVVGAGASVGPGTILVSGVSLGAGARIGADCVLHPRVVIQDRCSIGDRCILHPGVVIGADGFGYRPNDKGPGLVKIPHLGDVVIESDVEIGANSCVDRAKLGSTVIGMGTKIDNLVQVGHNCRIGRFCVLCGGVGIAGSVTLEDGVMVGGQAGIADNVSVGAMAQIGAGSGVMADVEPGGRVFGYPAAPARAFNRSWVLVRRLPDIVARLRKLEQAAVPR